MSRCPKCGRRFESPSGLKAHLRDRHRGYYLLRLAAPWIAALAAAIVAVTASLPYLSTTPATTPAPPGKMVFEVYHSPGCGCCGEYVNYLKSQGVEVRTILRGDMTRVKERLNIPRELWSCHTSIVGDYFVEGHVPLEAVKKLLDERPPIDGIALPGMPPGSPGMDGEKAEPFTIYSTVDGATAIFMRL